MSFTKEEVRKVFAGVEGISDEMIQSILAMHGKDLESKKVNLDNYVSKKDFDEIGRAHV